MALMKFREPNMAKWQGVRPGHNGVSISKTGAAVNTTTTLYTVPAGKTLFLVSWDLWTYGIGAGLFYAILRDVSDGTVRYLGGGTLIANGEHQPNFGNSWPPIEIPAGYDIAVYSAAANLNVVFDFSGWEE